MIPKDCGFAHEAFARERQYSVQEKQLTMMREPVAQSALHHVHVTHGAHLEARGEWQIPAHFTSVAAELNAARTALSIGERAGVGVLDIVGAGLNDLATRLKMQDVPTGAASPITVKSTANARWYRLTRQQARVIANLDEIDAARAGLKGKGSDDCLHVTNISSGLTTLVLAGPRSPDLLARLVRVDLDPGIFADRQLALTGAVGIPLQLVRWDRGDLLAYELTVGRDVAEYFVDSLLHSGDDLGIRFMGADSMAQ
jgi:glycine cleavage system aminomethyltransferase T